VAFRASLFALSRTGVVNSSEADISDWMFMRNGKIVGGETIKPLLKAMPKADADALRARMESP
jgi:uncharacterized protein YegJ (DUF2314 family)